jgi:hypothetical protein
VENFDPVGRWRESDGGLPVDASAAATDGTKFNGPAEFKAALRKNDAALAKAFTEHLLSYALGRKLEHYDEAAVDAIVASAAKDGYKLSRIVAGVAASYPFRHVRNLPPEPAP